MGTSGPGESFRKSLLQSKTSPVFANSGTKLELLEPPLPFSPFPSISGMISPVGWTITVNSFVAWLKWRVVYWVEFSNPIRILESGFTSERSQLYKSAAEVTSLIWVVGWYASLITTEYSGEVEFEHPLRKSSPARARFPVYLREGVPFIEICFCVLNVLNPFIDFSFSGLIGGMLQHSFSVVYALPTFFFWFPFLPCL